MKPHEIEKLSFEIIDREAGDHEFNQEIQQFGGSVNCLIANKGRK